MKYHAVVPSVVPSYTRRCVRSARFPIDVVDNTDTNRGVAASWNIGARHVIDRQLDWLVVVSAGVEFGPSGGCDFIDALDDPEAIVVEGELLGWHLIAFRRQVLETVGLFDENLYPAYWEDLDYGRRVGLAYHLDPPYWRKAPVDATVELGHGQRLAHVSVDVDALIGYMTAKHGGIPGPTPETELHRHPFNDPTLEWSWWPDRTHHLASRPYRRARL